MANDKLERICEKAIEALLRLLLYDNNEQVTNVVGVSVEINTGHRHKTSETRQQWPRCAPNKLYIESHLSTSVSPSHTAPPSRANHTYYDRIVGAPFKLWIKVICLNLCSKSDPPCKFTSVKSYYSEIDVYVVFVFQVILVHRLSDLVFRVPGYRSRGPGSILGGTRFF
jgi:hypothetical protein